MISKKEAEKMYEEWNRSCSEKSFTEYFGLSPQEMIEIADIFEKSRSELDV